MYPCTFVEINKFKATGVLSCAKSIPFSNSLIGKSPEKPSTSSAGTNIIIMIQLTSFGKSVRQIRTIPMGGSLVRVTMKVVNK